MAFARRELSEADVARISRMLTWFEQSGPGLVLGRRPYIPRPPMNDFIFGTIAEDLDNAASTELSTGETVWNNTGETIPDGSFVYAVWHWPHSKYYAFVAGAHQLARWIEFALPSALAQSSVSINSATVVNYWQGADPGETVTLINYETSTEDVYRWYGETGAKGLATLRSVDPLQYQIVDMECPPVEE